MNKQEGWELYVKIKQDIAVFLISWIVAIFVIGWAVNKWHIGFDDTDDTERNKRSGMGLMTDARTGCQYLKSSDGGITPRLNSDGSHICKRTQ